MDGKVLPEGVDDIGADMNLLVAEIGAHGAVGENIGDVEERAGIIARILALPGIERAAITVFACLATRAVEGVIAIEQQVAGKVWKGVGEKREHENFGVPKNGAFVHLTRHAARRDGCVFGVRWDNGEQVIHAEAQGLLCGSIPFDLDVTIVPSVRDQSAGVFGEQGVKADGCGLLAHVAAGRSSGALDSNPVTCEMNL